MRRHKFKRERGAQEMCEIDEASHQIIRGRHYQETTKQIFIPSFPRSDTGALWRVDSFREDARRNAGNRMPCEGTLKVK